MSERQATVQPGPVRLRAIVGRASGQRPTWIRNGEPLTTASVPADGRLVHETIARPGDWFSLFLRDAAGPTLFSGAIYVLR